MNLFRLSTMNLKQNLKNYGMYIFSMVFSITVFYNFISFIFSDQIKALSQLKTVAMITNMCAVVLVLFFIFFISYSSSFFIEQRKKEFGIYTFMGVENNKIALLFATEGLITGIIALIVGIFLGILVNKLFLMAIVKVAKIDAVIKFEVSSLAIIITSLVFLSILLFVFIKEYITLIKTDITKLINAKNVYQVENAKGSTLKGLLGFFVIILAYIFIVGYKRFNIPFPIAIMGTVIMIMIGTLYLFKGFFTLIISKIIKNKKLLYKKTNIVSYNNIIFRIKNNNKTLAQVAILITCTLTSLITAFCMINLISGGKEVEVPYSLYYISQNSNDDKIVDEAIKLSKEEIDFKANLDFIPYKTNLNSYINDFNIIRYSDIEHIMDNKKLVNEKKIIKNNPKEGEAIIIIPKNLINAFNLKINMNIGDKKIKINDGFASSITGVLTDSGILIVNDKDYLYFENNLKYDDIIKFRGITLKNYENTNKISSYIKKHTDMSMFSFDMFNEDDYNFINSVYFIGIFLTLVFMISLGSIMYFKCISDASIDKVRFETLRKLGISQEYINKAIYKQVGIFFSMPIIVGVIHSIVAGYAINGLFNESGYIVTFGSIFIFTLIYIVYYIASAKKYIRVTK
ncbi:ABC transporter permease [Clostridium sp. CCUG 7971]|uniref:FtsX-like permease family protein n=1 Tax=Clostridium sp. CCUG 7971 TaxID=2811414 RepID=UPI001ABBA2A1|nr:ABC transporter permease [Clostridium sp. CCUG 7971]MBO3443528.1 ABC transporter permease [Clostridium sp. CCUG 7971]